MGLDVYAVRSPQVGLTAEDELAFEEAGIELCGGIYSGGGTGWAERRTLPAGHHPHTRGSPARGEALLLPGPTADQSLGRAG
jgi:hypothetical protein